MVKGNKKIDRWREGVPKICLVYIMAAGSPIDGGIPAVDTGVQ